MQKDLSKAFGDISVLDARSADYLLKALARNDQPGFDYLEFKLSLTALLNMNMDENTAYRSAFATASTMGLTKESLLSTAGLYRKVLSDEKIQFDSALQQQQVSAISARQNKVKDLQTVIVQKEEKVRQLQAEIAQHRQEIEQSNEQIASAEEKIKSTAGNFQIALQHLTSIIDTDLQKIGQYL